MQMLLKVILIRFFAQNESHLAQTSGNNMMLSYNKNKIPITRSSCCLNKDTFEARKILKI